MKNKENMYFEAEGSYVRNFNGLPDATGFEAPKFIYEKQRKYVFRDAPRKKYYVLAKSLEFIYRDSFCPLPSPSETLRERTSAFLS